jgi:hypothetical protein
LVVIVSTLAFGASVGFVGVGLSTLLSLLFFDPVGSASCVVRPSTWQPPAFAESADIDRITGDSYGSRTFETGSYIFGCRGSFSNLTGPRPVFALRGSVC